MAQDCGLGPRVGGRLALFCIHRVNRVYGAFVVTSWHLINSIIITAGPRIWNSVPCGLRTLDISYKHFKTLLKTLCLTRPQRFVTFYISALEILLLIYLLLLLLLLLLLFSSSDERYLIAQMIFSRQYTHYSILSQIN